VPFRLYDSGEGEQQQKPAGSSVVTGTVSNNCDLVVQGKVLVRIPAVDDEVWARLSTIGGGDDSGIWWVPRKGDDVLVALNQNDYTDAFILGGLYSTRDGPPVSNAAEAPVKRVIKTGQSKSDGHRIELDDALKSINIVSTTQQKISIDSDKIEVSNSAGTLTITLDNKAQKITIEGVNVEIKGTTSLSMSAPKIDMTSKGPIKVASDTICSISGTTRVNINS
jgi:phage baseplate assembly protein V